MRAVALLGAFLMTTSIRAAPADEVMAADRAFAAAAKARGVQAAFVEFAAPDAVLFRAGIGPLRGHKAIGAAFEGQAFSLEWEPESADVAASGDLAWSWGYARWTAHDGSGKTGTSNYVSIWRRQPDGAWKWIVDIGVPAPPKPAPAKAD